MVKFYMKELLTKQFANIYPNGKNFLTSDQWFYYFLKRYEFDSNDKNFLASDQ